MRTRALTRWVVVALLLPSVAVMTSAVPSYALGSLSVQCVASSPTSCTATFALVPNMDVNLTFLLPANNGFYENDVSGTGPADYTNPNGYTSGVGPSFTVLLQTPASEPANAHATIVFVLTPPGSPTTSTTAKPAKLPAAITLIFAPSSYALSPSAQHQLVVLSKKLAHSAHVTFSGYAKSNALLARNRALVAADFLFTKVKIFWKVVAISKTSANKVTVVTTSN